MKEIQEQRVEKEMDLLSACDYVKKMKKVSKDEVHVEVEIPSNYISEHTDRNVEFLIIMGANFPLAAPKVFSKTGFCFPNISDGRDLLEDIINNSWHPSFRTLDVINRIPVFCQEFMKSLSEGILTLIGAYYLGEKYDFSFLESLPVHLQRVKEKVVIDGKEKEFQRILMVSDIYICLFEQDKWNKNNLMLIFWSNLRSLVTIKKTINGDVCKFYWKQKNKKKNFELILVAEKSSILIEMILDRMSKYGINYKINKTIPRSGKIPDIDIETVEKSILEIEQQIEQIPDLPHVEYLMDLYSKAVEYYSATNDPKFEYYKNKIHETLSTPRMNTFLSEETEHDDDKTRESEANKKETKINKVVKDNTSDENVLNTGLNNKISTTFTEKIDAENKETVQSEFEKIIIEKTKVENKAEDINFKTTNENQKNWENNEIKEKKKEIFIKENEEKEIKNQVNENEINKEKVEENNAARIKEENLNKEEQNETKYLKMNVDSDKEIENMGVNEDQSKSSYNQAIKDDMIQQIMEDKKIPMDNENKKIEKEETTDTTQQTNENNTDEVKKVEEEKPNEQEHAEIRETDTASTSNKNEEPKLPEKEDQKPLKVQVEEIKSETPQEKPKEEVKKDKVEVKLEIEEDEDAGNIQYSSDEDD